MINLERRRLALQKWILRVRIICEYRVKIATEREREKGEKEELPRRFPWDWEIKMSVSLPILSVGNCRPGHPWGVSEIAATYLNKTLYRGAIRPPIRIPTSIQINKLSCNECAALQGQPPRLTNCPTSSLPNVPVYILWYSPLVPTLHPLHSNRDKNEFATFAKEKKEKETVLHE